MLKVAEEFVSIQGEGYLTGVPMYFIRLAGCSVACPIKKYCDTDYSFKYEVTAKELYGRALVWFDEVSCDSYALDWVCITGGEPLDQDISELVALLRAFGKKVMIQTSGMRDISFDVDWLVVSPKSDRWQDLKIQKGHELKLVYRNQTPHLMAEMYHWTKFHSYFLQPYEKKTNYNTQETVDMVLHMCNKLGQSWRLTTQLHKSLGVR